MPMSWPNLKPFSSAGTMASTILVNSSQSYPVLSIVCSSFDPARSAIESFYLKQEGVSAIASSSSSSVSAVKKRLQRGREALLTCL